LKQRARTKTERRRRSDGTISDVVTPRLDSATLMIAVRALVLDLAQWASEEPSQWGPWVAPQPHQRGRSQRQGARVFAYDYDERVWNPPMPLLFHYNRSGKPST
jgi:hypothetical protein